MKKVVVVLLMGFLAIGILGFSRSSFEINTNRTTLPPGAPFTIFVNSNSNATNVSVEASFEGKKVESHSFPTFFTFHAPSLKSHENSQEFIGKITIHTPKETVVKTVRITVSNYAKPVIVIKNPHYISKVAKFDVKVYGGYGIEKIDFFVTTDGKADSLTLVASSCKEPSQILGIFSQDYTLSSEKLNLQNGPHLFIVKVRGDGGVEQASIASFYVNTQKPKIEILSKKCVAGATCDNITVKVLSPIEIKYVKINGNEDKIKRVGLNEWKACVTTPSITGIWNIKVSAEDVAGNIATKVFPLYVDGEVPTIKVKNDADLVTDKILWKRNGPLSLQLFFSAGSEGCKINPKTNVLIKNSRGKVIFQSTSAISTSTILSTPGNYTLEASIVDPINHKSYRVDRTFNLEFDNTPPYLQSKHINVKYCCDLAAQNFVNSEGYTVVDPLAAVSLEIRISDGDGVGIKKVSSPSPSLSLVKEGENTWSLKLPFLAVGEHIIPLKVLAEDKLGNSKEIKWNEKIFVDDSIPTIKFFITNDHVMKEGTYWTDDRNPLTVVIESNTNGGINPSLDVRINGTNEISKTGMYREIIKENGTYKISVVSTNVVNCKASKFSTAIKVKLDNEGPTIEKVEISPDKYKEDNRIVVGPSTLLNIKVKVRDNGVGMKDVYINGTKAEFKNGVYTTALNPQMEKSGTYTIKINAYDLLNNESSISTSLLVDTNPPKLSFTLFPQNYHNGTYWSTKNVPFYLALKSTTDFKIEPELSCTSNGAEFKNDVVTDKGIYGKATLISKSGKYKIECVAKNPVNGKTTTFSTTLSLGFDNLPPNILSIDAPATLAPNTQFKILAQVEDDGIGIQSVKINGKSMNYNKSSHIWCATLTTPNLDISKEMLLTLSSVDRFGNSTSVTKNVFVDATEPTIELFIGKRRIENNFEGALYFSATPTVKVKAYTAGNVPPKVSVYIDCGEKITLPMKMSGIHFIKIEAIDPINNKKAVFRAKFYISVDKEKPIVDIESSDVINSNKLNSIKLTASDLNLRYAKFEIKSEGKTLYSSIFSKNIDEKNVNLKEALSSINGQNVELFLTAEDLSGNVSKISKKVYVDTVSPFIKAVYLDDGKLIIKFSEAITGNPIVKVLKEGKIVWQGKASISEDDELVANPDGKLTSTNNYEVGVENVTDKVGNEIVKNFVVWSL